jgi:aminopeptidase N
MHFTGSTDSMLIKNYIYSNPLTLTTFKGVIDSVGKMVDYFSQIYSRYPFWNEKYGHCMAPLNGGMEHQTMTTIGFFDDPAIVAHELSHQWFGDNVTCSTWSDIFVNEGVASYSEDLFKEHFHSRLEMVQDMMSKQADVRKIDTGSVYCEDTTDESRIFSSRFSYHKGACLLHMLRYVIDNDSTFFQVYRSYQQEHKNGNGTIEDFRIATKSITGLYANGINIDTFFNQWAYKYGYPVYSASWNRTGNDFYMLLKQTPKVSASVACFKMPLDIMLHSASRDTMIRIMADQPEQLYHLNVSAGDSLVAIDPFHWVLDSFSSIVHDRSLSQLALNEPAVSAIKIYPNPASSEWTIEHLPLNSRMILTDVMGKVLWENVAHATKVALPASNLVQGVYILRVNGEGFSDSYKLIKE